MPLSHQQEFALNIGQVENAAWARYLAAIQIGLSARNATVALKLRELDGLADEVRRGCATIGVPIGDVPSSQRFAAFELALANAAWPDSFNSLRQKLLTAQTQPETEVTFGDADFPQAVIGRSTTNQDFQARMQTVLELLPNAQDPVHRPAFLQALQALLGARAADPTFRAEAVSGLRQPEFVERILAGVDSVIAEMRALAFLVTHRVTQARWGELQGQYTTALRQRDAQRMGQAQTQMTTEVIPPQHLHSEANAAASRVGTAEQSIGLTNPLDVDYLSKIEPGRLRQFVNEEVRDRARTAYHRSHQRLSQSAEAWLGRMVTMVHSDRARAFDVHFPDEEMGGVFVDVFNELAPQHPLVREFIAQTLITERDVQAACVDDAGFNQFLTLVFAEMRRMKWPYRREEYQRIMNVLRRPALATMLFRLQQELLEEE